MLRDAGAVGVDWLVLVALVIALAALSLIGKVRPQRALPIRARPLMTAREREAIAIIKQAVPNSRVHAQVAMAALIECKKDVPRNKRGAVRNRFDRKIIDFVIEDCLSGAVIALIELDDRTHNTARDRARDTITTAAGYRTIRLPAGKLLNAAQVLSKVAGLA